MAVLLDGAFGSLQTCCVPCSAMLLPYKAMIVATPLAFLVTEELEREDGIMEH